jgi:hypothetical protein
MNYFLSPSNIFDPFDVSISTFPSDRVSTNEIDSKFPSFCCENNVEHHEIEPINSLSEKNSNSCTIFTSVEGTKNSTNSIQQSNIQTFQCGKTITLKKQASLEARRVKHKQV